MDARFRGKSVPNEIYVNFGVLSRALHFHRIIHAANEHKRVQQHHIRKRGSD